MPEFKRSRLVRSQEDQITKKTVAIGLVTLLLFVVVLVFGLPFLVRFSIFLGQAKNQKSGEDKEKVLPPLAPRLIIPFEATNSATINISGLAEVGTEVDLLKNDVSVGKLSVGEDGSFAYEDIYLDEGVNDFSAVAVSEEGGSSDMSKNVAVLFDDEPPELTMINPSEEELEVDYGDFDIVGKSEKGVSVLVNNRVAIVDDEGQFKIKLELNEGKNEIEVVVRDMAGNETKKKIEITSDI